MYNEGVSRWVDGGVAGADRVRTSQAATRELSGAALALIATHPNTTGRKTNPRQESATKWRRRKRMGLDDDTGNRVTFGTPVAGYRGGSSHRQIGPSERLAGNRRVHGACANLAP